MLRAATLLASILFTSGCLGATSGSPTLEVRDLDYDNKSCSNDVPFRMTIANSGSAAAKKVSATIKAGDKEVVVEAGAIAPGEAKPLSAKLELEDRCFLADTYNVVLTVRATNHATFSHTGTISI